MSKKSTSDKSNKSKNNSELNQLPGIDNSLVIPVYPHVLKENSHKPLSPKEIERYMKKIAGSSDI